MESESPAPQPSPWKGSDFALPVFLLMPCADFASIYGDQAAALQIWGAGVVRLSPMLMLAAAVFTPLVLSESRLARWRHDITAVVVFICLMSAPGLVAAASSAIPLSRSLSHEEWTELRKTFEIPTVSYLASGEGHRLRVRRSDDTAELRRFLQSLGVLGTNEPS